MDRLRASIFDCIVFLFIPYLLYVSYSRAETPHSYGNEKWGGLEYTFLSGREAREESHRTYVDYDPITGQAIRSAMRQQVFILSISPLFIDRSIASIQFLSSFTHFAITAVLPVVLRASPSVECPHRSESPVPECFLESTALRAAHEDLRAQLGLRMLRLRADVLVRRGARDRIRDIFSIQRSLLLAARCVGDP